MCCQCRTRTENEVAGPRCNTSKLGDESQHGRLQYPSTVFHANTSAAGWTVASPVPFRECERLIPRSTANPTPTDVDPSGMVVFRVYCGRPRVVVRQGRARNDGHCSSVRRYVVHVLPLAIARRLTHRQGRNCGLIITHVRNRIPAREICGTTSTDPLWRGILVGDACLRRHHVLQPGWRVPVRLLYVTGSIVLW